MTLKYWTEEELRRARKRGAEIAAWFEANEAPCLAGCLCARCGGDPTKQQPTDGADSGSPKVRTPKENNNDAG